MLHFLIFTFLAENANITLPSNPKRTGKNPFDEYLHDADR